jgi:hypothetical protein
MDDDTQAQTESSTVPDMDVSLADREDVDEDVSEHQFPIDNEIPFREESETRHSNGNGFDEEGYDSIEELIEKPQVEEITNVAHLVQDIWDTSYNSTKGNTLDLAFDPLHEVTSEEVLNCYINIIILVC